jgi:hypothetical protein
MINRDGTLPDARFFYFTDIPMTPRPALRDAGGSLPIRAVQHCEAVTSACAFGWWLYPPVEASLMWDGHTIFYSLDGESFSPLDDACEFPGMAEALAKHQPASMELLGSPLFTAMQEQGYVQVSLGVIARTAPGWSLLLRRPANLPLFGGYDAMEGIVETDIWRGPLFINLRLTRTNSPIRLHANAPLVQAQPVPRWLYQREVMADMRHGTLADMTADDWTAWHNTFVEPDYRPSRRDGEYAVKVRKRRAGERCGSRRAACPG